MAKDGLGIGTSHGPMLSTPPEQWGSRVDADRSNRTHAYQGKTLSFDQLVKLRNNERLQDSSL